MEQGSDLPGHGIRAAQLSAAVAAPLLLHLAADLAAETSVYQCTTPGGAVEFRQRPCDQDSDERNLIIKDRKTGWVPSSPQNDSKPKAREQSSKRRSSARGGSDKARREEQCWKKRQLLDEVEWKLKRGYKASQSNKLRRKRRVYEDYLRQFCK